MIITAKLNWRRKDETIVVLLNTAVEMLYFEKLMHRHSEYESALDGYMHHVLNKPFGGFATYMQIGDCVEVTIRTYESEQLAPLAIWLDEPEHYLKTQNY